MRVKNSAVLGEMVYDHIKEMILTRQIRCGEKIPEQAVEQQLGVSRTPVREAVRRLSNEGIVALYPNRHAEVITFDEESIRELGTVRISMDCLAAQLAIQNGSNRNFKELEELADQCKQSQKAGDLYQQIQHDSQFHMKLVEISGNKLLIDIQKNIVLRTLLLQTTLLEDSGPSVCDIKHHDSIVNALYNRDLPQVLAAIQKHLCPFYHLTPSDVAVPVFEL